MPPTTTRPCVRCGASGPVVHGAGREVTVGSVAALLETGWLVECPAGHRSPPGVGDEVADEITERLPHAHRRRLARSDRCRTCDAELRMPVRRTERAVSITEVAALPVTTIVFDLPSTRCLECSTDQVPSRSLDDVLAAARALFEAGSGGV